jgi:DNA-binding MarR family transcriptional regulator
MTDYKNIFDLSRKIGKMKHKIFGYPEKRLTHAQLGIMLTIMLFQKKGIKNITVSMIAAEIDMPKPQVSRCMNDIENDGMIERINSRTDRREVYVNLTQSGKTLLESEMVKYEKTIDYIYSAIGENDFNELLRIFGKIEKAMEEKECSD